MSCRTRRWPTARSTRTTSSISPYLDSFNAKNGTSLVSVGAIHYEPFGIYGNGVTDLKDLAKGATIIIPADDSNETRALFLLQQEGLIKLPDDADAAKGVSTLDIVDDGGYNIVTVQADTVPAQLKNASAGTIAVINGNYALAAGLNISDALATENADGTAAQTYANIIAVRSGDENSRRRRRCSRRSRPTPSSSTSPTPTTVLWSQASE